MAPGESDLRAERFSGLPEPRADWCLFLDFDGTLVELRDHPDEVEVSTDLPALLASLAGGLGGAIAIVSGRQIDGLDRLLAPLELPVAGVHGLERRDAAGRLHRDLDAEHRLVDVGEAVAEFVDRHAGLYWEDKGAAFAIHYRRAPEYADEVRAFLQRQCDRLDGDFHLQAGKAVLELKPAGRDKGAAVAAFLEEPPFRGRTPVFIGDDVTDEDAFEVVNARGGHSIRIGEPDVPTHARYRIDSVGDALGWLAALAGALPDGGPSTARTR